MISFLRKRKQQDDTPTVHLMKRMRLSGKDLDLNRAGELSETQKKRVRRSALWLLAFPAFYVVYMVFIAYITLVSNQGVVIANLFAGGVLIVAFIIVRAVLYWQNRKMSGAHVITFTGHAVKHPGLIIAIDYEARTQHVYSADKTIHEAFIEGETYTFYAPSFEPTKILSALHVPAEHQ